MAGYPATPSASSPRVSSASAPDGVSVRPMRERHDLVKVLYTFDDQNKTNCLARWAQPLNIRTVYVDDTTEIGVLELKTCIQAIVSARYACMPLRQLRASQGSSQILDALTLCPVYSPELVAKLGQDYTVYAYDYSEYETPLVGQGMLSWILASASSTPSAPAHQSRTMITGRVCKNILGLFSNGVKETLEVKLRLVPVPTCLQSEYISNMQMYRELSKFMPEGFDAGAWTTFLQANPGLSLRINQIEGQSLTTKTDPRDGSGMELIHQLMHQGTSPPAAMGDLAPGDQQNLTQSNTVAAEDMSARPSRTASPVQSLTSAAPFQQASCDNSRASSRMGNRRPNTGRQSLPAPSVYDRNDVDNFEMGGGHEEEPARKRARITKTDWQGKSSFGSNPESLRVAASTAASIRVHRPIATHPTDTRSSSLQELPRAPTPRPAGASEVRHHNAPAGRSNLRRESLGGEHLAYRSPYPPLQAGHEPDRLTATSPDDGQEFSDSNTPSNIPSSPPALVNRSPARSSPVLPTLPLNVDSGFMSGRMDDLFDNGEDENRPLDDEDLQVAAHYMKRSRFDAPKGIQIEEVVPGPPELLPTRMLLCDNQRRGVGSLPSVATSDLAQSSEESQSQPSQKPRNMSRTKSANRVAKLSPKAKAAAPTRPPLRTAATAITISNGSAARPPTHSGDPVVPSHASLQRSQTWSETHPELPTSDTPVPMDQSDAVSTTKTRSGSGAKRKKAIQARLMTSIATGEMPPFCENCGAIETPTWRKAWVKVETGSPDDINLSDEDGGILALEELQREEGGKVNLYRVIKKSVQHDDEGFKEILLCNPCGLWLNKMKCMRPPDKWSKEPRDPNERKKKAPRKRKGKTVQASEPFQGSNQAQASALSVDETSPADAAEEASQGISNRAQTHPMRQRAASIQPNVSLSGVAAAQFGDAEASAALHRAIQSSPARFLGSQHSPIEVDDLTPKPTRRLLFPSPRRDGKAKTSEDDLSSGNTALQATVATKHSPDLPQPSDQDDKENRPPSEEEPDNLAHLFQETDSQRPVTPPPASNLSRGTPKTPVRSALGSKDAATFKAVFSSGGSQQFSLPFTPMQGLGTEQDRAEMTPFTQQLNRILSQANANTSPSAGNIDFGFLSSFDGNTPNRDTMQLELPHFDGDDLFSTNVPMPSSPPTFFSLYEDPTEPVSGLWTDYNVPSSPGRQTQFSTNSSAPTDPADGKSQIKQEEDDTPPGTSTLNEKTQPNLDVDFSALIDDVAHDGTGKKGGGLIE
ncbi:MAG: hypothetical protein M1835_005546 [Candelina submexicana]|nr:MAG: hypothetical protein M1835_005546 [Candelina submexicana]